MRLTLSNKEAIELQKILENIEESKTVKDIHSKLVAELQKEPSSKKRKATQKATQTRSNIAKEKIINSINMMRLEGKAITVNAIAQDSGVSYNTVKKYHDII